GPRTGGNHVRVAGPRVQRARQGLRLFHLLLHLGRHADDVPLGRLLSDRPNAALAAGNRPSAAAEGGRRSGSAARSGQHSRRSARPAPDPHRVCVQRLLSGAGAHPAPFLRVAAHRKPYLPGADRSAMKARTLALAPGARSSLTATALRFFWTAIALVAVIALQPARAA